MESIKALTEVDKYHARKTTYSVITMKGTGQYGTIVVVVSLTLTSVVCDLFDFSIDPPEGICYETYETKNALSCKDPRKIDNISCLEKLKDNTTYGLVTRTNETILFVPPYYNEENCFDVRKGNNATKICSESEPYGLSLTTPDNHTIWLGAIKCINKFTKEALKADVKFVSSFKFDRGEKSCYKIYNANEKLSPYTCAEINSQEICEKEIDNCSIITTPNGELVNLGCTNGTNVENNCVEVLHNSTKQKVCLEKLEERCVGFTVPSGLRILVACKECFRDFVLVSTHNSSLWKQHRAYIKQYLSEGHQGNHLHINKKLEIYENADLYLTPNDQHSCFDASSNCYLITLNSNETVHIYCRNGSNERPGCYKVVDRESRTESSACVRVIDEKCIGIITPKNTLVMLECFEDFLEHKHIEAFLNEELKGYMEGKLLYPRYEHLFIFKNDYRDDHCNRLFDTYKNGSTVITTPDDEKLLLQDTTRKNANGSYSLLDSSGDTSKVKTVILRRVDDRCIGITTPKGWNIVFVCYYRDSQSGPAAGIFTVKSREPMSMF